MAAVEGPPRYLGRAPAPPDLEHVEPPPELVAPGPEREQRARDAPSRRTVLLVELVVDARAGAVVLAHRVHRVRVVHGREVVGERLGMEPRAVAAEVELVRRSIRDHRLRE